jgi:hypothetical protein
MKNDNLYAKVMEDSNPALISLGPTGAQNAQRS